MTRNYTILIILTLSLIINTGPAFAEDNIELVNVSAWQDPGQKIAEDLAGILIENNQEIVDKPNLNIRWNPDGSLMLIAGIISVSTKNADMSGAARQRMYALYLANGDGSEVIRIEYCINKIQNPTWSPKGDVFFYEKFTDDGWHNLLVMDAKNLKLITEKKLSDPGIFQEPNIIAWSPEENNLLYIGLNDQYAPQAYLLNVTKNLSEELEMSRYKTYFDNYETSWSPDGKKIAFVRNRVGVFVLDTDTNVVSKLFETNYSISLNKNAFWSPDSNKLIFTVITGTGIPDRPIYDLYVINVSTGEQNKLFSNVDSSIIRIDAQAWLPGSDKVLVYTDLQIDDNYTFTLNSVSVDNGDKESIFSGPIDFNAFVSPDGELIGIILHDPFALNQLTRYGFKRLILLDRNGSNQMRWDINEYGLIWRGKNDLLLEIVNENQSNSLVILNTSTWKMRLVPLPDPFIDKVILSPTGRYLIARTFDSDDIFRDHFLELPEYDRPIHIEINDPVNEPQNNINKGISAANSTSPAKGTESPGFTAIFTLAGIMSLCLHLKSNKK